MTILETDRLCLRQLMLTDAGFILELVNEPAWLRFIGDRGIRTLDDARNYIATGPLDSYQRFGFGLYLVELKSDHIPLGICGLIKREALPNVDLGFALLPRFWGHGYALEAAKAVLTLAHGTLGLRRVVAITNPDNTRSIRVLEKLGLRFERMVNLSETGPQLKLFAHEAPQADVRLQA